MLQAQPLYTWTWTIGSGVLEENRTLVHGPNWFLAAPTPAAGGEERQQSSRPRRPLVLQRRSLPRLRFDSLPRRVRWGCGR